MMKIIKFSRASACFGYQVEEPTGWNIFYTAENVHEITMTQLSRTDKTALNNSYVTSAFPVNCYQCNDK